MRSLILKYGLILFAALSAFKFLEFQFFSHRLTLEIYLIIVATAFLAIGFGVAKIVLSNRAVKGSKEENIDREALSKFSPREQEILIFLAQGYTNKEIARSLDISPNTVKTHLSRVFEKLEVSNRTQAVAEANLLNLIG